MDSMSTILVLALALQETLPPDVTDKHWPRCGLGVIEGRTRQKLRIARPLVESRRWADLYWACLPTEGDGWGNDEVVMDFVDAAAALGRLPHAILDAERVPAGDGLNLGASCFVRYVRALDFRSKRDVQGLLNLVEEHGRARGWESLHPEDEAKATYLRVLVDLAGNLGDEVIDPLLARAHRDPRNAAGPLHVIAAIRSDRSRAIIGSWPDPLRTALLRTQEQPRRLPAFLVSGNACPVQKPPSKDRLWKVLTGVALVFLAFAFVIRNRVARLGWQGYVWWR